MIEIYLEAHIHHTKLESKLLDNELFVLVSLSGELRNSLFLFVEHLTILKFFGLFNRNYHFPENKDIFSHLILMISIVYVEEEGVLV